MNKKISFATAIALACSTVVAGCDRDGDDIKVENGTWEKTQIQMENVKKELKLGQIYKSSKINYEAPENNKNDMSVTLVLSGGEVVDYEVEYFPADPGSKYNMTNFEKGIGEAIIGQKISDAKVWIVNWASLTSAAFNKALDEIRNLQ